MTNQKTTTIISVTSGKGGVGKTLTTVNLAVAAARAGKSVLIFDGDLGLANVDIVLGLTVRYTIWDVLNGHCALEDVIVQGPLGISLIPAGSGVAQLSKLSQNQKLLLTDALQSLNGSWDLILVDTGAGIDDMVLQLNLAAAKTVVVTTPEPHAITDAYALVKLLNECNKGKSFDLLVNMTRTEGEGLKVYQRFAEVAGRFLDVQIGYLGHVPQDPATQRAVMQRRAASEQSAFTVAGQAWTQIARKLIAEGLGSSGVRKAGVQELWRHLLWEESPAPRAHASL